MTEQKGLLPCQLCGVVLTRQGDYTNTEAWNWYGHPNADDSPCLLAQHRIPTLSDLHTPSPAEAARWNTRAQPAEDERVKERDLIDANLIIALCKDERPFIEKQQYIINTLRQTRSLPPVQPAPIDFSCRVCGVQCAIAPDPPARAVCPEHCEDHDYEHDKSRAGSFCIHCDEQRPEDWDDD